MQGLQCFTGESNWYREDTVLALCITGLEEEFGWVLNKVEPRKVQEVWWKKCRGIIPAWKIWSPHYNLYLKNPQSTTASDTGTEGKQLQVNCLFVLQIWKCQSRFSWKFRLCSLFMDDTWYCHCRAMRTTSIRATNSTFG